MLIFYDCLPNIVVKSGMEEDVCAVGRRYKKARLILLGVLLKCCNIPFDHCGVINQEELVSIDMLENKVKGCYKGIACRDVHKGKSFYALFRDLGMDDVGSSFSVLALLPSSCSCLLCTHPHSTCLTFQLFHRQLFRRQRERALHVQGNMPALCLRSRSRPRTRKGREDPGPSSRSPSIRGARRGRSRLPKSRSSRSRARTPVARRARPLRKMCRRQFTYDGCRNKGCPLEHGGWSCGQWIPGTAAHCGMANRETDETCGGGESRTASDMVGNPTNKFGCGAPRPEDHEEHAAAWCGGAKGHIKQHPEKGIDRCCDYRLGQCARGGNVPTLAWS